MQKLKSETIVKYDTQFNKIIKFMNEWIIIKNNESKLLHISLIKLLNYQILK